MIKPQWLELPMSRTNLYGPKDVRVIKVRLYILRIPPGINRKWATTWENVPSESCAHWRFKLTWALCIPGNPKCAQWRFWSDCANAQADLNLHLACMSECTSADVAARIYIKRNSVLPEIAKPFHQLRCIVLVKLYVRKVDLYDGRAGVPYIEEHQFRLTEVHWCQGVGVNLVKAITWRQHNNTW